MLLELVTLLFSVLGSFGNDCGETCNSTETCCPGPNPAESSCCPFENAVCCEDGAHCCPEGSFCDLEIRMCGMFTHPLVLRKRIGDSADKISADSSENHREKRYAVEDPSKNEISHVDHMLVHCDLDQFCPFTSTCCHNEESDFYLCCPNPEGVCCPDEMHCCRRGEQCDSTGSFCLAETGMETQVRRADVLRVHYIKEDLDIVEGLKITRNFEAHSEY